MLALLIAIAATSAAAQRLSRARRPRAAGESVGRLRPVLPAVFGVGLPVAVLLYWLTTNLWNLGQQYVLLRL